MIDEDKSATNFMIQDPVMKALIAKEPITPFVERVQELYQKKGVSTILVIGGSSEYLQVADDIYLMSDYQIHSITGQAKDLQKKCAYQIEDKNKCSQMEVLTADFSNQDLVDAGYLSTYPVGSATEVLKVSDLGFLILGEQQVDIRMIHDIATIPQLNAIAFILRKLMNRINPIERYEKFFIDKAELGEEEHNIVCRNTEVEKLLDEVRSEGLETTFSPFFTECGRWMDLPRKYEVLAVLSRMRTEKGMENFTGSKKEP